MNDWTDLEFFKSKSFSNILKFLREERKIKTILPDAGYRFNAFKYTAFDEVKVIINGQDPYPTKGHAHGLAFSVLPDVKPLPKSLINIYKELKTDLGIERKNGCLTDWAEQGVLLLNSSLSVIEGKPASHSNIGWSNLTNEAITKLSDERENLVFILWGQHAISKAAYIDDEKHFVITGAHPSPLSASRGFFGSKPFSRANQFLKEKGIEEISW